VALSESESAGIIAHAAYKWRKIERPELLQGAGDAGFGFAGTEDTAGAPLFAHFAKGDGLRGAEAPLFHEALSG
jgi:hypothetical protein